MKALFTLLFTTYLFANSVSAAPATPEPTMSVQPAQCVSMKQGNPCYVTVEISWNMHDTGHYCLHSTMQKQPIQCWQNQHSAQTEIDIKTSKNVAFSIRQFNHEATLATGFLKLAWVYKKKGKPRTSWRLF